MKSITISFLVFLTASSVVQASIWSGMEIPTNGFGHISLRQEMDDMAKEGMRNANVPGLTLAVTKKGRLVYSKGLGFSNWDTQDEMQPNSRSAIGSTSKVILSLGMMHLLKHKRSYGLSTKVYGPDGVLKHDDYEDAYTQGLRRHYPIIGMAINADNR